MCMFIITMAIEDGGKEVLMSNSVSTVNQNIPSSLTTKQCGAMALAATGAVIFTVVLVNIHFVSFTLVAISKITVFILTLLLQIGVGFVMYNVIAQLVDHVYYLFTGEKLNFCQLCMGVFQDTPEI